MSFPQLLYRQTNRGIKYEYAIKRNASLTSVLPRLLTGSDAGKVPSLADTLIRRPSDPMIRDTMIRRPADQPRPARHRNPARGQ